MQSDEKKVITIIDYLANRLKHLRDYEGVSETELARRIGVSQSSINNWINKTRYEGVRFSSVYKALRYLGGEMPDLIKEIADDPNLSTMLIALLMEEPDLLRKFARILADKETGKSDKLRAEMDYLDKQK